MAAIRSSRSGLASAAALLLAAGGLAAFVMGEQAGREPAARPAASTKGGRSDHGPARRPRAPEFTTEVPYRGYSVGAAAPAPGPDGTEGEPSEPDATQQLARAMEKLVSDLEWNSNRGLPEPLQQTVAPMPDPWRPPPDAAVGDSPVVEQVSPVRASTRGGTRVVLRGRHLRPASIMFGDAPGSIVGASDREVTVLAPAAPPGAVTIAVTNTDGTFALVGTGFTFAD